MALDADQCRVFWSTWLDHRRHLETLETSDHPIADLIFDALKEVSEELSFEFCNDGPGDCEFIVTANGKASAFPLVDELVEQAPGVAGWKILALKPKLGFPKFTTYEGFHIPISDVRFRPYDDSGEVPIVMFVPGLTEKNRDKIHNGLLVAIDHGLGERRFAECINSTEVRALDPDHDHSTSHALALLDQFVSDCCE